MTSAEVSSVAWAAGESQRRLVQRPQGDPREQRSQGEGQRASGQTARPEARVET